MQHKYTQKCFACIISGFQLIFLLLPCVIAAIAAIAADCENGEKNSEDYDTCIDCEKVFQRIGGGTIVGVMSFCNECNGKKNNEAVEIKLIPFDLFYFKCLL